MDFGDAPEEAAFRTRLRTWLETNNPGLPASSTDDDYWAGQAAWHQSLYDGGFFGLSWPTDIGGHGMPSVFDVILDEELALAGAPPRPSLGYLVQGILHHGSEEIRQRFFNNMSKRAADMLKEEMEVLGAVRLRDVEKAQQDIVAIARKLEEEGVIVTGAAAGEAYVV